MSFEQLQQAILDEAKQQITDVKDRYQESATREEARIKEKARTLEEGIIAQAEREADLRVKRLHQEAQLRAKADILSAKQEELQATQRHVVEAILAWDEEQTRALLTSLLALVPEGEHGEIVPGAVHADALSALSAKRGLAVADTSIPNEGGFQWHGDRSDVDATISSLVAQLFAARRAEIAQALFG